MEQIKPIAAGDVEAALALAERCRATREPDVAESICLDVLEVEPGHQRAVVLLLLARTDQLESGLPHGVARAREALAWLDGDYDRAYYGGIICERQARAVLAHRGKRSGFVSYDWFQLAMEHYDDAAGLDPARPEPRLRHNGCMRAIERHAHCEAAPSDGPDHGIE